MGKQRLEAFSDGVLAIIITIMVLNLKIPLSPASSALVPLLPIFLSYALSFVYIGIYWNNHHHMMHLLSRVNGAILWANMYLLFCLSLIPFVTGWMGVNHFAGVPVALYGVILLMSALAYLILQYTIIASQGKDSLLARAVGLDMKGKVSAVLYLSAIFGAFFVSSWIAGVLYTVVALIWIVPDQRIVRVLAEQRR